MRTIIYFLFLVLASKLSAQQAAADALNKDSKSLNSRYKIIVSNSQNFTDYKVIKESYLNGFWNIVKDTLNGIRSDLQAAQDSIGELNEKIIQQNQDLELAKTEMAEMKHDSTHINAYGIDLHKGIFLTLFLGIAGGLTFLIVALYGRLSILQRSHSEITSALHDANDEFIEFRRKSLDKQMKLSRELQDERNKLDELVHQRR